MGNVTAEELRGLNGWWPSAFLQFRSVDGRLILHQRWDHLASGKTEWRAVEVAP